MKRLHISSLILIGIVFYTATVYAMFESVSLEIRPEKGHEGIITRENLIKIQQFILKRGKRETYCNMYNSNPTTKTNSYQFHLNPDTGQKNINCDPEKSKFHTLVIQNLKADTAPYRTVKFLDKDYIHLSTTSPKNDLTAQQLRNPIESALKEILEKIQKEGLN